MKGVRLKKIVIGHREYEEFSYIGKKLKKFVVDEVITKKKRIRYMICRECGEPIREKEYYDDWIRYEGWYRHIVCEKCWRGDKLHADGNYVKIVCRGCGDNGKTEIYYDVVKSEDELIKRRKEKKARRAELAKKDQEKFESLYMPYLKKLFKDRGANLEWPYNTLK